MSTVKFSDINIAFDTILYPFNNILLGLFVKGTKSVRLVKPVMTVSSRIIKPVAPTVTRVVRPTAPTYTRVI
tara:strand:- start:342 stop:557 length:216 start_codon:yes stop_codon:yes gene_type:complete